MEFFTWQMLATVAGATAATVIIVDMLRLAFGFSARWLALVVAAIISLAVWLVAGDLALDTGLLAVLNTFVVYAAATGGQAVIGGLRKPVEVAQGDDDQAEISTEDDWRQPWW